MVYATHIATGTEIEFKTASSFLMNCIIACERFNAIGLDASPERLGADYSILVL
jgi:hypothetical protein